MKLVQIYTEPVMNVNRNSVNVLFLLALGWASSACTKQDGMPVFVEASESRVLTVDEYLKQPDVRKKVFAACANDPGRKGNDANCVNALRAERIASAGTGHFPNVTQ